MIDQKERVIDTLMERIIAQNYPHGLRLPAERLLCAELSISRSSLREGLTVLSNWNVLKPEKGSGIKVLSKSLWHMQTIPFLLKYEVNNDTYPQMVSEFLTMRRTIFLDVLALTKNKKRFQLDKARTELKHAWDNRNNIALCTLHESNFIREILIAANLNSIVLLWNSISEIYVTAASMIPIGISIPESYLVANNKLLAALEKGQTLRAINIVDNYLKKQDKEIVKFIKNHFEQFDKKENYV